MRINQEKIEILSHPGPDRSIPLSALTQKRIIARRYRNRRIGEFLKELQFTEGRCTGMPKIHRKLASNGSPSPIIYAEETQSSFLIEFAIHPEMLPEKTQDVASKNSQIRVHDGVYDGAHDDSPLILLSKTELALLRLCASDPILMSHILQVLLTNG